MSDRLLSTGDAAEVLGVSEATVKRWADAGTLVCIRTPWGHRKFRLRDIATHLATVRAASADSHGRDDVEQTVSALLVGDAEKVLGMVEAARLRRTSFAATADGVLLPAVARIQEACGLRRCEVFHLHIAINTLIEVVARQKASLRVPGSTRGCVVAAPMPGDSLDLSARLAAVVAVEGGFASYVMGVGLTARSVARAASDLGASWVVLAGDPEQASPLLPEYLQTVLARAGARIVCVGGSLGPLPDEVLVMNDLRGVESLLAPSSNRVH